MRRTWLVTAVAALQTLSGLAVTGVASVLLIAARNATTGDSSDLIAAGTLAVLGLLVLISSWGLWRGRNWGWWLGLVMNGAGLIIFLWDPITRRVKPDSDESAFIALFAALVLLLILAPVRKFYLHPEGLPVESTSS